MHSRSALFFSLLLGGSLAACASAADPSAAPGDTSSEEALDSDSAPDAIYIANAKAFFEALLNEGTNHDTARIPYDGLPAKLAKEVERNNPDPNAEWADQAFKTKVKNARGHLVTVYGLVGGIDDEGESITLFTSSGRDFAEGDDYRGMEWTK